MTDDPVNPKHYDGRACADIGERLSANGYQILKYTWRLGKKDQPSTELGKALWYLDSELELLAKFGQRYGQGMRTAPMILDLGDPEAFFKERITGRPDFTRLIAAGLWAGYNLADLRTLRSVIETERQKYAGA